MLVVTRRRKTEKEVRLLPNRHGLGRDCLHNIRGLISGVTSEAWGSDPDAVKAAGKSLLTNRPQQHSGAAGRRYFTVNENHL